MAWWHLTWKDLRLQLRDRRSLAVLLVLPLIFISIIGLSTGRLLGWRATNQIIQVAWVDQQTSELSQSLRSRLENKADLEVITYSDAESAKRDVTSGKVTMVVKIGPQFQERVNALELRDFFARKQKHGKLADGLRSLDIEVQTKASWNWIGRLVTSNLLSLTLDEIFPLVARRHNLGRMLIKNMEEAALEEEQATSAATEPVAEASEPSETSPIAEGRTASSGIYGRLVPGFTVMFAFFLVNVMARAFIAERDLGTLRRLRIAPLTPVGLLIGKTLPFFLISVLQNSILFLFGRVIYDMDWGEQPWLLIPTVLCTSLAATSLGLLIATSVRTDAQVSSYSNLIVISLAGISGCFIPRDWMPDLLKEISVVTPHTWSLIGFLEVLTNPVPQVAVVVQSCLMLLGFTAVFFGLGCWRFRSLI